MAEHFARSKIADGRSGFIGQTKGVAIEEPGGEHIAGTCGIDKPLDRSCRHRDNSNGTDDMAALFAVSHRCQRTIRLNGLQRRIQIRCLIKRFDLGIIGEQNINRAILDEVKKFFAPAVNAERV